MTPAFRFPWRRNISSIGSTLLCAIPLVLIGISTITPAAAAAQASTESTRNAVAPAPPPFGQSLRPALDRVGSALQQVRIDRWKLSRAAKAQLQNDASSIQQDLSGQLPGLLQAAEATPGAIGPQLVVMRNLNALYDVLVRLTTAANLSGGKTDPGILDGALQGLESARKMAADELVTAANLQDQQIAQFRAQMQAARRDQILKEEHPKTIVVNNGPRRRARRRKRVEHRKSAPKPSPASTTPSPESKTGPAQ